MSKKRFGQAFAKFIRQGVAKITPRIFFQTLAESESERAQKTKGAIIARVEEVFGSREKAEIWLNEPNRALNMQTPLDLLEDRGPLGGIHTALQCRDREGAADSSALTLACDLPFITTEFLSFLCGIHQPADSQSAIRHPQFVTVPLDQSNRLQPLAAIYDQSCQVVIEQMLAAHELRVDLLYSRVPARIVNFVEFAHLPNAERFFININTPEEYRAAAESN